MSRRETQPLAVVSLPGRGKPVGTGLNVQGQVVRLRLDLIDDNPIPARTVYPDALIKRRAAEIIREGLLDPIKVRKNPDGSGRYYLIDGKTRLEAYRRFRIDDEIDSIIKDVDELDAAVQGFSANHNRDNGTDIDEAFFLREMMQRTGKNQSEIAEALELSKQLVSAQLSFFKLPAEALETICQSEHPERISYKHVQQIIAANLQNQDELLNVISDVIHQSWPVSTLKSCLAQLKLKRTPTAPSTPPGPIIIPLAAGGSLKLSKKSIEVVGLSEKVNKTLSERIRDWIEEMQGTPNDD